MLSWANLCDDDDYDDNQWQRTKKTITEKYFPF